MSEKKVILKKGKEKALRHKHHWIFSGAILHLPEFDEGEILPVFSFEEELLGQGYFNKKAKILGRMICFDGSDALQAIQASLYRAIQLRRELFQGKATNAYRLINAEGDGLPGLIIDQYDRTIVLQITTQGMERLRPWLLDWLIKNLHPDLVYEKSTGPARREEGLSDIQEVRYGNIVDPIPILENGHRFYVSLSEGQKTGFFLDHREMRQLIQQLSAGKRVLNCFSYTGGFTIYAAKGGAVAVDSVDVSTKALNLLKHNAELNGVSEDCLGIYVDDVFQFLRQTAMEYDLVILDPPAFAKKKKDIIPACRGYKDINRIAMQKMPTKSLLLTCSCSHYIEEALFQKVLFQAAIEANRRVKIIGKHQMAADHPINIFHPESDYLKSFLLYIE